jgi:hypothetical protein
MSDNEILNELNEEANQLIMESENITRFLLSLF